MLASGPGAAPLAAVLLLLLACLEPPPSFARVDAEAARKLLVDARVVLVSALGPDEDAPVGGGVRWRLGEDPVALESPPEDLPAGDLLIVASRIELGTRLAAALARPRNRLVWLFIPGSAEERRSVYVVRFPDKENPRGADS